MNLKVMQMQKIMQKTGQNLASSDRLIIFAVRLSSCRVATGQQATCEPHKRLAAASGLLSID
jgi:hypothetical protein